MGRGEGYVMDRGPDLMLGESAVVVIYPYKRENNERSGSLLSQLFSLQI
jgi:hypothetical protein